MTYGTNAISVAELIWQTYETAAGINTYLRWLDCTSFDFIPIGIEKHGRKWEKELIKILNIGENGENGEKWKSEDSVKAFFQNRSTALTTLRKQIETKHTEALG